MRSRRTPGIGAALLLAVGVVLLLRGGSDDESADDAGTAPAAVEAEVVRVVDGDTIEVSIDGRLEDVRYIGVDTPESVAPGEPVECFGHEASAFNERLVAGQRVRLRFDRERRDRYGRLLAYVHVGSLHVNAELVRHGFASTLTIAPNDSRAVLFERLERRAGRAERGMWGACP